MRKLAIRIAFATLGLFLAAAPLAASAQAYFAVSVGGPGYAVRYVNAPPPYGYVRPYGYARPYWHPRRYWRPHYWRPVAYAPRPYPVVYAANYGWAPAGYYGYRWHDRWYHHRRWARAHWNYY